MASANETMKERAKICYVVHAPEVGRVKIGTSANLDDRLQSLQTNSPCLLHLVRVLDGGDETEWRLHQRFQAHHKHGEWFCDEILPELMRLSVECLLESSATKPLRRRRKSVKKVHPNSMAAKKWGREEWFTFPQRRLERPTL